MLQLISSKIPSLHRQPHSDGLEKAVKEEKTIKFLGDFNVIFLKEKNKIKSEFKPYGLRSCLQNIPIQLCKTAETLIDYIIREQDFIKEIFVSDTVLGTDYQMVTAVSGIRPNNKCDANLITIRDKSN